jgi:type 1 glutamine amidotransferase
MKKAIFVRGGRPAHQPVETTEHFRGFLEAQGYEISVSDSPAIYADAEFMASVDLIIQCIESEIDEASVQGLTQAVENGTGLIGWHGGVLVGFTQSITNSLGQSLLLIRVSLQGNVLAMNLTFLYSTRLNSQTLVRRMK